MLEAVGVGGVPLPRKGKPKTRDEVCTDWISRGITGDLPPPLSHEVLQLALSAWYLKEMGRAMGLDKSQQFEMSLCSPIAFEFLPCYNRSSLLAQAKLNPSFPIVGGAQRKVSGALIFGPFPKAFSLRSSQQSAPFSCQSQEKTPELLPVCKTSAFTIWHSVGLGWQGIWLASQDLLYLLHCVLDLGPLPSLIPMLCIQPHDWFLVSLVFLRPRKLD